MPIVCGGSQAKYFEALPGRHPQRAVEPDRLAVEHPVLDDLAGQLRVLRGPAEALREGDARAEFLAGLLGQCGQERRVEQTRGDRVDPDPYCARSRAAGSVSETIPPLEAA